MTHGPDKPYIRCHNRKGSQEVPRKRVILGLYQRLEHAFVNNRNTRRGAAVVEFALIAPIFILLVFGMIEFGRMVMVQQVLTNASREGARLAVLDGTTTSDVTTAVGNYLTNAAINSSQAITTVSPE